MSHLITGYRTRKGEIVKFPCEYKEVQGFLQLYNPVYLKHCHRFCGLAAQENQLKSLLLTEIQKIPCDNIQDLIAFKLFFHSWCQRLTLSGLVFFWGFLGLSGLNCYWCLNLSNLPSKQLSHNKNSKYKGWLTPDFTIYRTVDSALVRPNMLW